MKKLITLFILALTANFIFLQNASAQINLVGVSTPTGTATGGSTTLTINKPAGLAVGHVMIANIQQVGVNGNSLADATRTGWTEISGNSANSGNNRFRGTLLYRVADAADVAAVSFAFTIDAAQDDATGSIVAFSGVTATGGVTETGAAGAAAGIPGRDRPGVTCDRRDRQPATRHPPALRRNLVLRPQGRTARQCAEGLG